jgi:hypothetical protein
LLRTLHGSVSPYHRGLDGVAVVSDIVASLDPAASAQTLRSIISNFRQSSLITTVAYRDHTRIMNRESVLKGVRRLMLEIRDMAPLVHQVGCWFNLFDGSKEIVDFLDHEYSGTNSIGQRHLVSGGKSHHGNRNI